jgi:hypothetical protein
MPSIDIDELRLRAALANPNMTSDQVRREADRVRSVLDSIAFEDAARAEFAAAAAEDQRQQDAAAQRRREAFADAQSIVRKSRPGWDDASVAAEADRLVSENERALAELALKEAIAAN